MGDNHPCHVWITRPQADADQMAQQVSAQGMMPWVLPVLAIEPYPVEDTAQAILTQADQIIVTSRHAIAGALAQGLLLPRQVQWFAVGKATAEGLLPLDIHPILPEQQDSEGLLALAELDNLQDKRVAILKGIGGRPVLAEQLKTRGAIVTALSLYQRQCTTPTPEQIAAYLGADGRHLIALASGETLTCLLKALSPAQHSTLLSLTHLVVMSTRIAQQAEQAGWRADAIHIAPTASADGLLSAMTAWRKR